MAAPTGLWAGGVLIDGGDTLVWRTQPDGTFQAVPPPRFAIGGGDSDILLARDGTLYAVDLSLASITSWTSPDRGTTWSDPLPLASGTLANDRMWLAEDDAGAVYLLYNQLETGYWVSKTTDGGKLWLPIHAVGAGQYPSGPLVHTSRGVLAFPYSTGPVGSVAGLMVGDLHAGPVHSGFAMFVATSTDGGLTWTEHMVAQLPEWGQNLFPSLAADTEGNLYAVWSEGILDPHNPIKYAVSTDDGQTWSAPRVLVAPGSGANKFPWAVATTPGHLGVAYFRSEYANDDARSQWRVEYALTHDALSASPSVQTVRVDETVAFTGALSGLSARPVVGDFLTLRALPDGRAVVAWAESNGGDRVKVAAQLDGPTL